MRARLVMLKSLTVLAIAAGALIVTGATAHASGFTESNLTGPYACGVETVQHGNSYGGDDTAVFIVSADGAGGFTAGHMQLVDDGDTDYCDLGTSSSSYDVDSRGNGHMVLFWENGYECDSWTDNVKFVGSVVTPGGHFSQLRIADNNLNNDGGSGSGSCQHQIGN
jgi:hypothetical protein